MRKGLLLIIITMFMAILIGGCSGNSGGEDLKYTYKFRNNSSYSIQIKTNWTQDWNGFTMYVGDVKTVASDFSTIEFTWNTVDVVSQNKVKMTKTNGEVIFSDIVSEIKNNITVSNRVDINKSGNASGLNFSIHLITWGVEDNLPTDVWFTPDREYNKYYPGNNIPTLKVGHSDTQSGMVDDEYGRYLYYVLTGANGFEYYRTASLIKVGANSGRTKSYTFYANSEAVETDENGFSKSVRDLILVEKSIYEKRSEEKIIPVIRIK